MSSRTADIDFTFAREVTVRTIVEALATSGWSLEEPLSYMVNDTDLYDWQSTTNDHTGEVLALLDAPEHAKYHVAVCVYHGQAGTGGQLLFFPHRTACSFSPTINRRSLPGSAGFTDVSWYLHALVPPLLALGLEGYEARDIGS
ncbi:hypothetical protein ACFVRD_35260 [Streptomyces sp. NPDC057908]|uniref:hypothetical protein n=1 Tax=Streptomyces sp. NPDC057908 TaxID=3346276 RepID=UPI0036E7AAC0